MREIVNFSRRAFLKTGALIGGGLVLGIVGPANGTRAYAATVPEAPFIPEAFVRIGTDGAITIIVNKSEMGQGVYTSLPMLVAEELECNWSKIRVEAAPVDPVYNHTVFGMQMTGGSTSVPTEWERMRKVGAAAREMLVMAAADTWKVQKEACRAENGVVYHGTKKFTYGQLATKASGMPVPANVQLKDPSLFKIIGKPTHRIDSPEKVNGRAVFGIDVTAPGTMIVLIAHCPVFGGKAKSFSSEKARAVPGVKDVVQIASGIAVVGDNFWSAYKGRNALEVVWDEGPLAGLSTSGMRKEYAALVQNPGIAARKEGDPEKALGTAAKTLTAEYEVPFLAHAAMEPLNCFVDLRAGSCEIWTGTQSQTADRDAAAQIAGLKPEAVKLHTAFLGGGFGRRANPHSDFVSQSVQVAKAVKKPGYCQHNCVNFL
ncbi:MAG: Isoquinoline 1-oxidoreductase subunit beta [Syntrophorhabdus sp. PtaU1.Bin153]|nr:MAG: Isoquinoline 1-oxidoreductase subunit beta [Syntrophorhabdus sp. PtaU1.Bin153]